MGRTSDGQRLRSEATLGGRLGLRCMRRILVTMIRGGVSERIQRTITWHSAVKNTLYSSHNCRSTQVHSGLIAVTPN